MASQALRDAFLPIVNELQKEAEARTKLLNEEHIGNWTFKKEDMWEWKMAEKIVNLLIDEKLS